MTVLTAGSPEYLSARIDGAGVNFCLFSAHAERVVLCVFYEQGGEQQWELPGRSGDRWHGHLAGAGAGLRYGFGSMALSTPERAAVSIRQSWLSIPDRQRALCSKMPGGSARL